MTHLSRGGERLRPLHAEHVSGNPVDTAGGLLCLGKDGESGAPSAEILGLISQDLG